jgi:hypothetical protein
MFFSGMERMTVTIQDCTWNYLQLCVLKLRIMYRLSSVDWDLMRLGVSLIRWQIEKVIFCQFSQKSF